MTGYLTDLAAMVWALRFVIVFVALLLVTALWLDARHERDKARQDARRWYFELLRTRAERGERLRQIPARRRKPIIASRVVS